MWQNDNGILNALLPASRFKDFLAGEQTRGLTQYWHRDRNVSDTIEAPSGRSVLFEAAADIHATAAADSSASATQTAEIRKDTVLEKYHFWCAYGPEDHSSNLPTAEKREQGERRRLTEHGESIKRGCQAHFSVTHNSGKFYRQYQLQHNVESVEAAKRAIEG
ncbi:g11414 [Coccomyxa elongata]